MVPFRVCGLAAALLLGAWGCRAPAPAPARGPAPPLAAPSPAGAPRTQGAARPQFIFATWSKALPLIRQGRVTETVTGSGGVSLILDDHTWVHLVAEPGDPLPRNLMDQLASNAPNAKNIKHSKE